MAQIIIFLFFILIFMLFRMVLFLFGREFTVSIFQTFGRRCAVLVLIISPIFFMMARNYGGYCGEQGRSLSDDEKINIAVAIVNSYGTIPVTVDRDVKYYTYVRYRDTLDFITQNPDCCRVSFKRNYFPDGLPPVPLSSRVFGFYSGDVVINYVARYIDDKGQEQSVKRLAVVALNNCGKQISLFF